jgi:general secretion pathway protein D
MKKIYKSHLKAGLFATCVVLAAEPALAQVVQQAVQTSAITPYTQAVETGPVLDVVPYVLSDGYTINLTLIPSDTEFTGYGPTPTIPNVTGNLNVVEVPSVNPMFTVKTVATTVNVWDNQTVVLGGLITSTVQNSKQQVPLLGDLPLFGRFFQSQSKSTQKENLMIFVTALIVDPAGNRVHSDDELPFAQSGSIPPQAPGGNHISESVKTVHSLPVAGSN